MGYESRLYIVDKSTLTYDIDGSDRRYAQIIAQFDLCKIDNSVFMDIDRYSETDAYIYVDGNLTYTDCYGAVLTEIPLKDAIKIFSKAVKEHDYRRYKPCLGLLKGFDPTQWTDLVVLHYGY